MTLLNQYGYWIFAVVLLGATIVRMVNIGEKSFWGDEIHTIASAMGHNIDPDAWAVRGESFDPEGPVPASEYLAKAAEPNGFLNISSIINTLKENVHPPLFFIMEHVAIHLFGLSPLSMRLVPALLGVMATGLMFLAFRRWGGLPLGVMAAAVYAFAGYQVEHAQDARQYTWVTCLALTTVWLLDRRLAAGFREERQSQRWWEWLAMGLCTVFGMYSQYLYAVFVCFWFPAGLYAGRHIAGFGRWMWGTMGGVILCGLPWIPVFLEQRAFYKAVGHFSSGLWNPIEVPEFVWRNTSGYILSKVKATRILMIVAAGFAALQWWRQGWQMSRAVKWCLAWLGLMLAAHIGFDVIQDSSTLRVKRYVLLIAPAFYGLIAVGLLGLGLPEVITWVKARSQKAGYWLSWARPVVATALLTWMVVNSAEVVSQNEFRSDDFKRAANYIEEKHEPGDVVMVHKSGAVVVGMSYYLKPEVLVWGMSRANDGDSGSPLKTTDMVDEHLDWHEEHHTRRVWWVFSHMGKQIDDYTNNQLEARHWRLLRDKDWKGVRVYLWEAPPPVNS